MNLIIITLAVAVVVGFISAAASSKVAGQTPANPGTIQALAGKVETAFENRELATLDGQRLLNGRIRIVIEHSLIDDTDPQHFEIRTFRTFAAAQRWLQSRELSSEGLPPVPIPSLRPLQECRKGVCTYDFDGGINHKHLYLQKISYGIKHRRPYLKTLYLLDGD